jgi:hypothetical protein
MRSRKLAIFGLLVRGCRNWPAVAAVRLGLSTGLFAQSGGVPAAEYHHWCPVPAGELLSRLGQAGFAARLTTEFDETYLRAARGRTATGRTPDAARG